MDKAVEELQQELKVLKNEIKETLTDVREVLLNTVENPFPQDLSARPMASSPAPQAAPRPSQAPQQEVQQQQPQQQPNIQQQNPMGQGGGYGGGPMVFGNMGGGNGGGFPAMPQMGMSGPSQVPDAHYASPDAPSRAPEHASYEPQSAGSSSSSGGGPGLPPSGGRRERPSTGGGRRADSPGLPPRGRDSGDRRPAREEEEQQDARGGRPSRGRSGPESTRLSARRRHSAGRATHDGEAYDDAEDDGYEDPYEDGYEEDEEDRPAGKVDLVVLASLSPWLSDGIRRIGRKRLKAVLDIYASMGSMTRDLRDILVQIVDMDDTETFGTQVSVQDSMRLLIELDDLMWRGRQDWRRAALMTMLSADEGLRP